MGGRLGRLGAGPATVRWSVWLREIAALSRRVPLLVLLGLSPLALLACVGEKRAAPPPAPSPAPTPPVAEALIDLATLQELRPALPRRHGHHRPVRSHHPGGRRPAEPGGGLPGSPASDPGRAGTAEAGDVPPLPPPYCWLRKRQGHMGQPGDLARRIRDVRPRGAGRRAHAAPKSNPMSNDLSACSAGSGCPPTPRPLTCCSPPAQNRLSCSRLSRFQHHPRA
jgi:hypothetical protein